MKSMWPGPDLSPTERDEVKKVARDLLNRIKTLLVLNWRQRSQSRAQVRLTIENTLDDGLPRAYTPELYNRKVSQLFEHLYERYPGESAGIYERIPSVEPKVIWQRSESERRPFD